LKRLIITADDFGAAREVNEAVEAAHRDGVLTAASLMIAAPAAADAIARARRLPSLRVGLHLVLLQGRPVLPPSAVPQLVKRDGSFPAHPAALGTRLVCSRSARRQLAAEIDAQFAAFSDSGLALDHCNAHLHFHLHPLVGRLIAALGPRFGLRAVRLPLEPRAPLRGVERRTWSGTAALTLPFALALRRRLAAAGLLVAERTFGLRWSGQMTRARLAGIVRQLPAGVSEIYLHPATGPYPGAARGYRYAEELQALLAPEVMAACRDASLRLGGFGDFAAPVAGSAPAVRRARRSDASRPGVGA
jgi:hopanoid biosynthesis associated protein HpnK